MLSLSIRESAERRVSRRPVVKWGAKFTLFAGNLSQSKNEKLKLFSEKMEKYQPRVFER